MKAEEAREITNEANFGKESSWWSEYKVKLFKAIKMKAEEGQNSLSIRTFDNLNKNRLTIESKFIDNINLRTKLTEELEGLGYEVNYSTGNSYEEDVFGKEIIISW